MPSIAPAKSLRRAVIRARMAQGADYHDVRGRALPTEQEVLDALDRDHVVHYDVPPALLLAPMADAEDGEQPGLIPAYL